MRPVLFSVGDMHFHAYLVALAIAFVVCSLLVVRETDKRPEMRALNPSDAIWIYIGAIVGAKAWWIVQYASVTDLWRALLIWEAGLVYYGGLLGGVAAGALVFTLKRVPLMPAADVVAPYLALGQAITRVGCFLNGCCWGRVTRVPWAVCFPHGSYAHEHQLEEGLIEASAGAPLPVHPTQLYMVGGLLLLALGLKALLGRKPFNSAVATAYLGGYGALRFVVEAFRGDSARPALGMSVSQMTSLALIIAALFLFLSIRLKARRDAAEAPRNGE